MSFLKSLDAAASGLSAQRLRMDVISQNIANINTTRTENGQPYRRKIVLFEDRNQNKPFYKYLSENAKSKLGDAKGVRVSRIVEDPSPFKRVYEPGHPDADENGYVNMPNVDLVTEMINMISASRAYETNVTSINTIKSMALKALEIGK
ncbi:MAG TPA: flagellar basal body rod protein FlgC [Clostridiaceae bacterium]|nr:flagellar basal body rod protein FlgC [Clostridiaceae bacterium]